MSRAVAASAAVPGRLAPNAAHCVIPSPAVTAADAAGARSAARSVVRRAIRACIAPEPSASCNDEGAPRGAPSVLQLRLGVKVLLDLDGAAGLFELGLELVGLFALDALLDGLRRLVDER